LNNNIYQLIIIIYIIAISIFFVNYYEVSLKGR